MAKTQPIAIDQINQGGLADSKFSGQEHSVARLVGFDLHSVPGLLKVRQKLTKISETIAQDATDGVDALCKVRVNCSDGNRYFFSSTSGKIWKVDASFAVTKVHTTTPGHGDAGCLGAWEYYGYIYWATEETLHRIAVSGLSDWATNAEEDWAELNLDQDELGGDGSTYAVATSISESADLQSIVFSRSPLKAIAININTVGTGNWTVTLHNAANGSVASKTIANGSVTTGWNIFEFSSLVYPVIGDIYHIHITSTVGDGVTKSSVNNNLKGNNTKIYTTSEDEFHPMREVNRVLYIGDRYVLHQVDASAGGNHAFSLNALDLIPEVTVTCLGRYYTDILIGAKGINGAVKSRVYRWNGTAESFSSEDEIDEDGINAFMEADNYVIVNCGLAGNLYFYNGEQLELLNKVPGEYSASKQSKVHANSVGTLQGLIVFGFSQVTGDTGDLGVYLMGRYKKDYPLVLDLSFPISERSGSDFVLTDIEVGAISIEGLDMVVAWKNGSSYGFDKLDYSNKLDGAFFESRVAALEREMLQNFGMFMVAYEAIPASCDIDIAYKVNHGSYIAMTSKNDTDRLIKYNDDVTPQGTVVQMKVTAQTNSDDAPSIESAGIFPKEQ